MNCFGRLKSSDPYLQIKRLQLLTFTFEGLAGGSVDPPQFEMPGNMNAIEGAVGLSLESFHEAVEIDGKVVPESLLPPPTRLLHEKGFDLQFCGCRTQNNSSFGLDVSSGTLVRSETVNSMLQLSPWKK